MNIKPRDLDRMANRYLEMNAAFLRPAGGPVATYTPRNRRERRTRAWRGRS